jgi:hypothetical protein
MTDGRLRSRAYWGGVFLTGFLLAAPAPAEAEIKANAQGFDKAIDRARQALGEAEENGKSAPRVEQAVDKLLRALEEEEREHRHHRHHQEEGTFGAGFKQAGDPSIESAGPRGSSESAPGAGEENGRSAPRLEQELKKLLQLLEEEERQHRHHRHHQDEGSFAAGFEQGGDSSTGSDGSTGSSDSGDSSGGGTGSGSPMAGGAGSSPSSTPSSAQSKGQQSQHGGQGAFARGLKHAEREERARREERRERRLEHAFARGLAALRTAEEHANATEAKSAHGEKSSTASKTAGATPRTGSTQTVGTSPKTERHEHQFGTNDQKPSRPAEAARKSAGVHPTNGGKEGSAAGRGHTGGLAGQHFGSAHPPTGSAGHASPGQHAGSLAGRKHPGHK